MPIAYVGVGSNLGDRAAWIARARRELEAAGTARVIKEARLIETESAGGPPQPRYLNTCWEVETSLGPLELLTALLETEARCGRERSARWGPRTIDLDLLFYESIVLKTGRLALPHPRLAERLFVLEPLHELNPDFIHPVLGVDIHDLLLAAQRLGSCT